MRHILDSGNDRWSVQVIILAFACASFNDVDARHIGTLLPSIRLLPVLAIITLSIIVGAAAWVILLFIVSWIAAPIGRLLGGTATAADARAALAWGMVPVVWSPLYRIPVAIMTSGLDVQPQANAHRILLDFAAHGGCSIIVIFIAFQLLFAIACIVVGSFTLAEAQRFSTQKGFINLAIALALPLMVIGSAVFTFRR